MHPALAIKDIWFSICGQLGNGNAAAAWPLLFVCRASRAAFLADHERRAYYQREGKYLADLARFTGLGPWDGTAPACQVSIGEAYFVGCVRDYDWFEPLRDLVPSEALQRKIGVVLVSDKDRKQLLGERRNLAIIAGMLSHRTSHSHDNDTYSREYADRFRLLLHNYGILLVGDWFYWTSGVMINCVITGASFLHVLPDRLHHSTEELNNPISDSDSSDSDTDTLVRYLRRPKKRGSPDWSITAVSDDKTQQGLRCYPLLKMRGEKRAVGGQAMRLKKEFLRSHHFIFNRPL
jgi:hypothetical protein